MNLPLTKHGMPTSRQGAWLVVTALLAQLESLKEKHPYRIVHGFRQAFNRIQSTPPDPHITESGVWIYPGDAGSSIVKVAVPGYRFRFKLSFPDRAIHLFYSVYIAPEEGEQRYEAELRAQEKLREHVSPEQWRQYVITSTLVERSKLSGFVYLFRRGFPTLVYKEEEGGIRFHIGLCFHVYGHEPYSWKGALCPTDDVIAHLLLMRADEARFWKKANHHSLDSDLLGI